MYSVISDMQPAVVEGIATKGKRNLIEKEKKYIYYIYITIDSILTAELHVNTSLPFAFL